MSGEATVVEGLFGPEGAVTLELDDETAQRLRAYAAATGKTPEQVAAEMIELALAGDSV